MKKALKILTIMLLVITFISASLYLAGVFFYQTHFLPNTYINDINVQNKTTIETKSLLESENNKYKLTIIDKNNEDLSISGEAIDYSIEINLINLEEFISNQKTKRWIFGDYNECSVNCNIHYNKEKLITILKKSKFIDSDYAKNPVNAIIEKSDNGYVVVKENNGNMIEFDELYQLATKSILSRTEELILTDDNYLKAEITENDENITSFMEYAKKLNELIITYDFEDRKEELNFSIFKDWIDINEDYSLIIDESKVNQYVINLASKYDTYQKERTFNTSNNKEIKVSGGIYGWQIDIPKTTSNLIETIKIGISTDIKPNYKGYAMERGINDIGNTYIEISIDEQHMWFYKDGELLVSTDVVTGWKNKHDTPKGVFTLWSRETNRYLRGANYKSWVNYWMPVNWNGIGIHDASWRSAYGNGYYKTNGSHGCINTPYKEVKKIYENVKTGTPVIIY